MLPPRLRLLKFTSQHGFLLYMAAYTISRIFRFGSGRQRTLVLEAKVSW